MHRVTGSTDKLERSFAIGAIVAAILVGAVLYVLYPNSFKNNLYGGTNQGQSQAGSSSQYGGSASAPAPSSSGSTSGSSSGGSASAPAPSSSGSTSGSSSGGSSTGNSGY